MWNLWKLEANKYRDLSRDELTEKRMKFNQAHRADAELSYQDHAQKELQAYCETHPLLSLEEYAPKFIKQLNQPNLVCSFHKGFDHSQALAPLYSRKTTSLSHEIESIIDTSQLAAQLQGSKKSISAGLLLTFPDGRIVVVEPSGHFAGYSSTFSKGRVEKGHSIIQTALKETLEETGFNARIDGKWYGLYQGSSTWVLMLSAEVIGGDPADCDFETDKVHLVPRDQVLEMLKLNQGAWPYRAYQDFLNGEKRIPPLTPFEISGQHKRILSQEAIKQELSSSWEMLKNIDRGHKDKQLQSLGWTEKSNQELNRHVSCVPFDSNRVVLGNHQYISASCITGLGSQNFIATQGPMEETQGNFWRMLFEQTRAKTGLVVMVTNTQEEGVAKCIKYWPEKESPLSFEEGAVLVEALGEEHLHIDSNMRPLIKRSFAVTLEGKTKQIDQLHLQDWPDKGCVKVEELSSLIRAMLPYHGEAPITVHCSRGIGRTSSVILASVLFNKVNKQLKKKDFIDIDIFNIVRKLKESRRHLVPALDQGFLAIETAFQLFHGGHEHGI